MKTRLFKKGISPIRILPLGFLAVACVGTALLMLPGASVGEPLEVLDALFTSVSASCVTGLVVVDTGTHFTPLGQGIILLLIQLGGLGFMTAATFLFVALGVKISLKERMVIAEGLGSGKLQGVVKLGKSAVVMTFLCEGAGALLLSLRFVPRFGFWPGVGRAVFHSVSAFCNAGFDVMGNYASFMEYVGDPLVNFTLMFLVVAGGLGFVVIADLAHARKFSRLKIHTKIVLWASGALLLGGALLFFCFEYGNPDTLGPLPLGEKVLAALFQSVTCRTAGFNTINQPALRDASKLLSCVLMFIGGAPAGTAGGVKVTTIAMLILSARAVRLGRPDAEAFGRRIHVTTLRRALYIFILGLGAVLLALCAISLLELNTPCGELGFLNQLFEVVSAMGTVGISVGVTALSGGATRLILCLLMFLGRVGLLTVALAMGGSDEPPALRYPEGEIMVG